MSIVLKNILALRRVLVIYKCSRFARTDKHTPKNYSKKETLGLTTENGTKMGFARRLSAPPFFLLFRFLQVA